MLKTVPLRKIAGDQMIRFEITNFDGRTPLWIHKQYLLIGFAEGPRTKSFRLRNIKSRLFLSVGRLLETHIPPFHVSKPPTSWGILGYIEMVSKSELVDSWISKSRAPTAGPGFFTKQLVEFVPHLRPPRTSHQVVRWLQQRHGSASAASRGHLCSKMGRWQ